MVHKLHKSVKKLYSYSCKYSGTLFIEIRFIVLARK